MAWSTLGFGLIFGVLGSLLFFAAGLRLVLKARLLVLVDTLWGMSFVVLASVGFLNSLIPWDSWAVGTRGVGLRQAVLLVTVALWGMRLTLHLHRRNHGQGEDERYTALLARTPGSFESVALRRVFLPQGLVSLFIGLPILVGMAVREPVGWSFWVGAAVWAVGFGFETVGDQQLTAFRSNPANRGRILDTGLWGLTRHPNYFGDATVWTGMWLMASGPLLGWLTAVSPLAMTYLLYARTGKALLERHMAARRGPEYQAYVERVSGFFPLPPKNRKN